MPRPRTLIIGLDGATFDLIDPWVAMGRLPTLARLMREGVRSPLPAFPNMNSASAWTSIVTGCNPGKHGIYDFGDDRTIYDPSWRPTTALDRRRAPFWQVLTAAGQRVGVMNVPISYPADQIDGFMISGMDAPGVSSAGFANPARLIAELRRDGIDYVLDVSNLAAARERDPYHLPVEVRDMVSARARAASFLMQQYAPDVTMVVFTATDRMQHNYWGTGPLIDDHPSWQPLAALYGQIDAWIGRLWEQVGPSANVVILSDHGFGPYHRFSSLVNPLFAQRGWLSYRSQRAGPPESTVDTLTSGARALRGRVLKWALLTGRRYLPGGVQFALANRFPKLRQQALHAHNFGDIDWTLTRVYAHVMSAGIMVQTSAHDVPRRPAADSSAYEALRGEVRSALLQLRDPALAFSLVREVWRREDLYQGPHIGRAPDMQIEWDEDAWESPGSPSSPVSPVSVPEVSASARKGRHRSRGMFVACGPHIRRGGELSGSVSHYDIAPTLYYLQGLPVPEDLDGNVLSALFPANHLARYPVEFRTASTEVKRPDAPAMDETEARQVEQRLRDLGYL